MSPPQLARTAAQQPLSLRLSAHSWKPGRGLLASAARAAELERQLAEPQARFSELADDLESTKAEPMASQELAAKPEPHLTEADHEA